jgi:hypothetical protein
LRKIKIKAAPIHNSSKKYIKDNAKNNKRPIKLDSTKYMPNDKLTK